MLVDCGACLMCSQNQSSIIAPSHLGSEFLPQNSDSVQLTHHHANNKPRQCTVVILSPRGLIENSHFMRMVLKFMFVWSPFCILLSLNAFLDATGGKLQLWLVLKFKGKFLQTWWSKIFFLISIWIMIILLAWLASSLVTYQNLNIKILYTQYGFVRDELRKTSP